VGRVRTYIFLIRFLCPSRKLLRDHWLPIRTVCVTCTALHLSFLHRPQPEHVSVSMNGLSTGRWVGG